MGPKVHEAMTNRPRAVTPETTVSEAAQLMKSDDIGSLPIVDGEQLAGVVTDRDIVIRAIAEGKDPRGMPVREVASRELVTVHEDQDLATALQLMASQQVLNRNVRLCQDADQPAVIVYNRKSPNLLTCH